MSDWSTLPDAPTVDEQAEEALARAAAREEIDEAASELAESRRVEDDD